MRRSASRRSFLRAAVAVPGIMVAVRAGLLPARAFAQEGNTAAVVQRIAWLLFPFEGVGTAPYERVASAILADRVSAGLVGEGVAGLDAGVPGSWLGKSEDEQLDDLRAIESGAFFGFMLQRTRGALFTDREIWDHLGYGGSSMEFGGYIDRGLDDIDWLEEV